MSVKSTAMLTTILLILAVGFLIFSRNAGPTSGPTPTPSNTIPTDILKTYTNTVYGFEFQYPEKWVIRREHDFLTYYSKFFLTMAIPTKEGKFDETFLVNIVLPEFIRGFDNLEKTTSEIVISGVRGIKYEYVFNDFSETTVILPFGELQIILGTGEGSKQYLDEFNQILASFKFLK